jgi:oxygen-independent coproporphyrinogen-3 oxidase
MDKRSSFGIYVHVPYCLQRCTYCDFATYVHDQIMPPSQYFALVAQEIQTRSQSIQAVCGKTLDTVYFGGGTPSLVSADLVVGVLANLRAQGFELAKDCEITLEINPATVDPYKMDQYQAAGFNRFSVGAQTFDDALLKSVHREHNAMQTRETLKLLQARNVNYSFDLLFSLPGQSLEILTQDLQEVLDFRPHHVSPYCLTVPEGHVLSARRPPEDQQVEMFEVIHGTLTKAGYDRYEISNYARDGFESRHNNLYWKDDSYWGLGLSAHSFAQPQGLRFWNPSTIGSYAEQISRNFEDPQSLPPAQFELLETHQSLTDFCHTSLRLRRGLSHVALQRKFGEKISSLCLPILAQLVEDGLIESLAPNDDRIWRLTERGVLVSNQVFGALTFLANELPPTP